MSSSVCNLGGVSLALQKIEFLSYYAELFGQIVIVRPVFHPELKNIFYLLGNTIFLQLHVSMQILERRP